MTGVFKSKKFWVALVLLVLIGVGVAFWMSRPAKVNKTTKADITKGVCDDDAYSNLIAVKDAAKGGADKAAEGKAYENLGLCFIYRHKDQEALPWFKQAKAAYDAGHLAEDSNRIQSSIDAIEAEKNRAPAKSTDKQLDGTQE